MIEFGFISAKNGQGGFFHCSAKEGEGFDALEEDTNVEFNLEKRPESLWAVNIEENKILS